MPDAPRSDDPQAVESLAEALAAVDFSQEGIRELLGEEAVAALGREQTVPARWRIRRILEGRDQAPAGRRRLAGATDFFLLGGACGPEALEAILGQGAHALLSRLGLLTPADAAGRVRAAVDLRPHAADDGTELWVASDLGAHQVRGALRTDHVLGVGQASLTLAQVTERTPVDRALDLGTGCGIQTFHLLAHVRHVTATDLSARALAFTRFNLVLNAAALGLDPRHPEERVALRQGSLLEPVAGEVFDLVVSNPPFVITPRREGEVPEEQYTYRDGGMAGDQLVATLVRRLPEVLAPGGRAQLLGNWEIPAQGGPAAESQDPDADGTAPNQTLPDQTAPSQTEPAAWSRRPRSWLAEGTEAWFIQREEASPEEYAHTWLQDAGQHRDPERYEESVTAYLEDFAARGVGGVGFGMVWLRRPASPGARLLRRFEEITHPVQQPLGPVLTRDVAAWDRLAGMDEDALCRAHLEAAEDVTEERHQRPGAEHPGVILLRQGAGLRRTELLDTAAAGFVSACDGELSTGQILQALGALLEWDGTEAQVLLERVRRLVERGFLRLP